MTITDTSNNVIPKCINSNLYNNRFNIKNIKKTGSHKEKDKNLYDKDHIYYIKYNSCIGSKIKNINIDEKSFRKSNISKKLINTSHKNDNKNNEKFLIKFFKDIRGVNRSPAHIKRNTTIKEEDEQFKKASSTCKNMFRSLSPRKGKIKEDTSSENLVNIKTRNKFSDFFCSLINKTFVINFTTTFWI